MDTMSTRKKNSLTRRILFGLATATICFGSVASPVYADTPTTPNVTIDNPTATGANAMPTDGAVPNGADGKPLGTVTGIGSVTNITTDGVTKSTMNIYQETPNAVINWNTFNVGSNSTVNFIQPSVSSMTLNNVVGDTASTISGNINSIGSLIFINPNGMLFDSGSVVNAAGIIASTAQLANGNENFYKNGPNALLFSQGSEKDNNIIIKGRINAETNGSYITEMKTAIGTMNSQIAAYNTANKTSLSSGITDTILNTVGIKPATGFSAVNNVIKLVADGDIAVTETGSLQARTTTSLSGTTTAGVEGWTVEGSSSARTGSIVMRADQNANELAAYDANLTQAVTAAIYSGVTRYDKTQTGTASITDTGAYKVAKVYLHNTNASQIAAPSVAVYYEPDITSAGLNGTAASAIGIQNDSAKFTQKDYTKYNKEVANDGQTGYKDKVAQTIKTLTNGTDGKNTESTDEQPITSQSYNMLVNNVYQLEAIQDTKEIAGDNGKTKEGSTTQMVEELASVSKADTAYYGNLGGGYAQGTGISALVTKDWNTSDSIHLGFNPIGSEGHPFTGGFSGNGGSNGYGIYDLSIQRANENNVGLFAYTSGAYIGSVSVIDSKILGTENVGGIAGYATGTEFSGDTTRKRYSVADGDTKNTSNIDNVRGTTDVGGLVGEMTNSTIRWSTNASQVEGTTNTGGLVGNLQGGSKGTAGDYQYSITQSKNLGYESSSEDVNLGYGVIKGTTKTGGLVGSMADGSVTESYSNGQVSGQDQTGGLIGEMDKGKLSGSYNTNEATILGTIDNNAAVGGGTSIYGKVTGTGTGTDTGGLIGKMTDAGTAATIVDTAYNAGNVSGATNVGGLVGNMTGGTITRAYNGDNNTVIYAQSGIANEAYVGFKVKHDTDTGYDSYTYDSSTQMWKKNSETTEIATKGIPDYSKRIYNNRLAYRDATVNGTTNIGGLVGNISGSSSLNQTYNAGKVTGSTNVGAAIGTAANTASVADSFYITTNQDGTANLSTGTQAIGSGSLGTNSITAKTLYQAENLASDGTTAIENGVSWTGTANQTDDWMVYSNSAAPLLKHFMKSIDINRQYEYDGTTHNLITADIADQYHYYGGAFFSGGKGQNVNNSGVAGITDDAYKKVNWTIKTGSADADHSNSELYHYDQANMWSPQHGYYTKGTAAVIITPVTLNVGLTGTTTYGKELSGYSTTATGINDNYKLTIAAAPSTNNTQAAVSSSTGLLGSDTTDGVFGTGWDIKNGTAGTGASEFKYGGQQTNAGSYATANSTWSNNTPVLENTTTDTKLTTANKHIYTANSNYIVKTSASLTVNKAKLYVNINGSRTYGDANSTGSYEYTAVKKNTTDAEDADTTNGQLKSWDTLSVTKGTATPILYSTSDVYHNSTKKDTKEIGIDANVVVNADNAVTRYTLGDGTDVHGAATAANYNLIFDASKSTDSHMTINPAALTYAVSGSNTYGEAEYTYTIADPAGIKTNLGDTAAGVTNNTTVSAIGDMARIAKGYNEKTDVTRGADNEVVNLITAEKVTLEKPMSSGNNNYQVTAATFTYKVNPATITYTADDKTKVYGKENPTFTGSSRGTIVSGDESGTALPTEDFTAYADKDKKKQVDAATHTGTYAISVPNPANILMAIKADKQKNYEVTVVDGTLTITPKTLNYNVDSASREYGAANPSFSGHLDTSGLVTGDTITTTTTGSETSPATAASSVGSYGITADQTAVNNLLNKATLKADYTINITNGTLTITPKNVTYKVGDASREYGAANPNFSGSFTGLVNGDTGCSGQAFL